MEFKYITQQKKQIKDGVSDETSYGQVSSTAETRESEEGGQNAIPPQIESLDENVITQNSFCILIGASLR